jgi:acetyl-CoA carboxylase biotin carboxyl carrier protein
MRAKQIQELVGIVEKSNIDEIEVTRWWGHKVRIRKNTSSVAKYPVETIIAAASPAVAAADPTPQAAAPVVLETPGTAGENANYVEIKAPMVGTFYRANSPDAAPYVKEGDVVSKGQILCIIEAMKLMNELEADASGRIVKVLADNAQPVEYNQPLFLIDPS